MLLRVIRVVIRLLNPQPLWAEDVCVWKRLERVVLLVKKQKAGEQQEFNLMIKRMRITYHGDEISSDPLLQRRQIYYNTRS